MKLINLHYIFIILIIIKVDISAQNIKISAPGGFPNEPSIIMDPNNTNNIVAGANLQYYYLSSDGGATWSTNTLNSSYGVWGDPSIDVDSDGNFYFFHLSNISGGNWIDRIVCQKSTDNGATWNDGSYTGLNGTKAQDKQWSVIDRSNNNIYLTWTEFDSYGSHSHIEKTRILFSKSLDQGQTWSTPIKINSTDGDCVDEDNTVEGAVPAVGPNGEIYVSWVGPNGLVFNRSTDEGDTWLTTEIPVTFIPGGWDFSIPGLDRANGLPVTKCDISGGANDGTIYINWSDQRNGTNNTDIWLVKSTDQGNTWSSPIKVNNDNTNKHQFLTWMDIDQTNGNLYFVFYDRRNYGGIQTDVYLAISSDGGDTFINRKISESPFSPNENIFFGDYTNIVAHNNVVRPIWARLAGSQSSIWTDITPLSDILNTENSQNISNEPLVFPNPSTCTNYISFKLHEQSVIKIELFDQSGKLINTIIKNDIMAYGKHVIPIDTEKLNLSTGAYFYKLSINDKSKTIKIIIK